MTLDDIIEAWRVDSKIDPEKLDQAVVDTPFIHGKYLKYLTDTRLKLKLTKIERNKVYHKISQYYRGDFNNPDDLKEIGREPFLVNTKSDRAKGLQQEYVMADDELLKVDRKIAFYEETTAVLEEILKQINQRQYLVKGLIEWYRLTNT